MINKEQRFKLHRYSITCGIPNGDNQHMSFLRFAQHLSFISVSEFLLGLLGGDNAGHRGLLQYNCTCYMKYSPIARPNSQPDITMKGEFPGPLKYLKNKLM